MWGLRWRANLDHGPAATLVQAARRLETLPQLAAALARGDVSLAHVTAVTKACVPGRAQAVAAAAPILTELACSNPPRDVRRAVRHLADIVDPDGSDPPDNDDDDGGAAAEGGDGLRGLTLRPGLGGRGRLEATLDPLTREALAALLDAFDTPDPAGTPVLARRTPAQRRHDAFAALLHTLLAQPDLPRVQDAHHDLITTKGWNATLSHSTGEVTWTAPDGRTITVPPPRP
jgi:hypothetical protein